MQTVYAIGETVLDIIFKEGKPVAAKAGGSMLNACVSLGRMNVPVSFISEYAADEAGNLIDGFLKENNVSTEYANRFNDGKTHLALAFLNEKNNATYNFYKEYPADRLTKSFPDVKENDIVMYGSIYSILEEIRPRFLSFLQAAKEKGAILVYDPNFRAAHLKELPRIKPFILENISLATIIRGSDEDFSHIFGAGSAKEAFDAMGDICKYLVYTENEKGVTFISPKMQLKVPARKITPVSTIGAGDNFDAGMVYSIFRNKIELSTLILLNDDAWRNIISTGIDFASEVCMSYENYISPAFAGTYLQGK